MFAEYTELDSYDIIIGFEHGDDVRHNVIGKMLKACVDSIDFFAGPCDGTCLGEPEFWGNDYAVYRFETGDAEYVITPDDERQLVESGFVIIEPFVVYDLVDVF